MVLWVVLENKNDVEAFSKVFGDACTRVIDNVWLVRHEAPESTPNPCEDFRNAYQDAFDGLQGQLVVGYVQAIAGFGDEAFAKRIEALEGAAENSKEARPAGDGGDG